MKIVKFIKSLLYFLLFLVFSFIIRFVGFDFIFHYNNVEEFDVIENSILYLFILIVVSIICCFIYFIKTKVNNSVFYYFSDVILNNKLKIFSWITFLFISISSGLILVLYPIIYYYIFKIFFKKFAFIRKYYLDFNTVKKYTLVFFIIELPLVFLSLCALFDPEADGWTFISIYTYYMLGNFYFYLPFFILSWWDNRKLKTVN